MKLKLVAFSLIIFCFVSSADAHRLNEYLQATTVSLYKDHAVLQLRLTAGSDVATKIIGLIDVDGNAIFSNAEQEGYAKSVLGEISVAVNGKRSQALLQSWTFPNATEMKNGLGEIQLTIDIAIPAENILNEIVITNHHQSSTSVYLVNCLLPADTSLHVTRQSRNYDQSVYSLAFTTASSAANAGQQNAAATSNRAIVKTYFIHGIKHILSGFDHLLFLCALVLGAAGLWDLIKIVTAFTIAHSITLTLATFGLAHLPSWIVEPLIAASIVFVALQNIYWPQYAGSKVRLITAFFFGLFHGLGFAGGLLELMHSMPTQMIWYAILGFSIGVEAGNQLVLLPLFGLIRAIKRVKIKRISSRAPLLVKTASALVALAGMYYFFIAVFD